MLIAVLCMQLLLVQFIRSAGECVICFHVNLLPVLLGFIHIHLQNPKIKYLLVIITNTDKAKHCSLSYLFNIPAFTMWTKIVLDISIVWVYDYFLFIITILQYQSVEFSIWSI